MKKIDHYKAMIDQTIDRLICPKCGERFMRSESTLVCGGGHCFDIAAKGYLNFITGAKITTEQYDDALFGSREYVFDKGFFEPLLFEIKHMIIKRSGGFPRIIADIGCGEGSALKYLTDKTGDIGIGLDISKQGILAAARRGLSEAVWIVGDLTRLPLADQSVGVLLNMLSPANYKEFDRTVHPGGMVIKILPGTHYLRQMRAYFYKGGEKEHYSNALTAQYFKDHYPACLEKDIAYSIPMGVEFLLNLARMSPLASGQSETEIERFAYSGINEMTVEFKILAGYL